MNIYPDIPVWIVFHCTLKVDESSMKNNLVNKCKMNDILDHYFETRYENIHVTIVMNVGENH